MTGLSDRHHPEYAIDITGIRTEKLNFIHDRALTVGCDDENKTLYRIKLKSPTRFQPSA